MAKNLIEIYHLHTQKNQRFPCPFDCRIIGHESLYIKSKKAEWGLLLSDYRDSAFKISACRIPEKSYIEKLIGWHFAREDISEEGKLHIEKSLGFSDRMKDRKFYPGIAIDATITSHEKEFEKPLYKIVWDDRFHNKIRRGKINDLFPKERLFDPVEQTEIIFEAYYDL